MSSKITGTCALSRYAGVCEPIKHTAYEVMHIRKIRFPFEIPLEDELTTGIFHDPIPNEIAEVYSKK